MADSIEIRPTHYDRQSCGCIYVGYRSWDGSQIFWRRQSWCGQDEHVIGRSFTAKEKAA